MSDINEIIETASKNDKIEIVYGDNSESMEGYIHSVSDEYITIHEYVPDIYRTINRVSILEMSIV